MIRVDQSENFVFGNLNINLKSQIWERRGHQMK